VKAALAEMSESDSERVWQTQKLHLGLNAAT